MCSGCSAVALWCSGAVKYHGVTFMQWCCAVQYRGAVVAREHSVVEQCRGVV